MVANFVKVPGYANMYKSVCGTKVIDHDERGWKLYSAGVGRWVYYANREMAFLAAK